MIEKFTEVFTLITELAEKDEVAGINLLPGCWEREFADGWRFAVNGHGEHINNVNGQSVPPCSALVEHNGTPIGVVDPFGGTMIAGSEGAFIDALKVEVAR